MHEVPMDIQHKKFLSRPVDEGLIILNPENGEMYKINSTGQLIWNLSQKGLSKNDITQQLTEKFDVSTEEANDAISDFMSEFKNITKC